MTAGYALFQAANTTALMSAAATDQRGVTSALLALTRNLGLVAGASAMGMVFSVSSEALHLPWLSAGGATGLQVTFVVAGLLASVALAVWLCPRARLGASVAE